MSEIDWKFVEDDGFCPDFSIQIPNYYANKDKKSN